MIAHTCVYLFVTKFAYLSQQLMKPQLSLSTVVGISLKIYGYWKECTYVDKQNYENQTMKNLPQCYNYAALTMLYLHSNKPNAVIFVH